MRNLSRIILLFFTVFIFSTKTIYAQNTAQDWTKTDCANKEHQLFSELESGKVVILIYIALTSNTSYVAVKEINKLIAPYATSHPGRVEIYVLGYSNNYTCEHMNEWMDVNKFTNTRFAGHNDGIKYYGFNESTVAVLGGAEHKVLYKKVDYTTAENTKVTDAINYGLQLHTSSINDKNQEVINNDLQYNIYPNPANNFLNIKINENWRQVNTFEIVITDITGKQLKQVVSENINIAKGLNIADLSPGLYFLNIYSGKAVLTQKLIIQRN